MRILVVYPRFAFYGGAELVIVRFCNYLSTHNIKHALLTTQMIPEVEKELHNTEIILAPVKYDRLYTKFYALLKKLRKVERSFDVVNLHNFPAEFLAAFTRLPSTWLCNEPELSLIIASGTLSPLKKMVFRGLLALEKRLVQKRIKKCFVADATNASRFLSLYGVEPKVLPYGIDHEFFAQKSSANIRETYGLVDTFLLLQVGTLTPYKNQLSSLSVLRQLREEIPSARLVLAGAGEGEYHEQLHNYIKEHSLESYVLFTGHVDRETVRDLFCGCDLLLHPVTAQGGWLAPFEALCTGTPVVVSSELMAAEIFAREGVGVVTDEMADTVLDFFRNRERYLRMAEKGQKWVKKNLDWDIFGDKMLEACKDATGGTLQEMMNSETR